jgi:PRC-barrel domain
MRNRYRVAVAIALVALYAAVYSAGHDRATAQPQAEQPLKDPTKPAIEAPREATVTVFDNREVQGVLGKEVRSAVDESMGRIVNVIVDRTGEVRAAVIEFGGFLGGR